MGRQTTGLPQGGGLYPNDPNSMFAINMGGGQAVLKVSVNNPAARAQPVGEEQGKKFSTRRVPQSAAAEDVTFALVNSGMFGQAVKRNEDLQTVLRARAEGRFPGRRRRPARPPPAQEAEEEMLEVEPVGAPESHLHVAVREGHAHSIKFLLEQEETDIDVADGLGNTPLHLALEQGQEILAALLVQHGARVDVVNSLGRTPLHLAA